MVTINILKIPYSGIFPKGKLAFFFLITVCCCLIACGDDNNVTYSDPFKEYEVGKNCYTINMDGDSRYYCVHAPGGYNINTPAPVVFILHGSSGNGEEFYNKSGWKELGNTENILTVYPTAWTYCTLDGKKKKTTKWNVYSGEEGFCAGETPRDDIGFLKQIVIELKKNYNVDSKRIYVAGFGNGGAMAGRCAVEMSDIFAAVVESAGTLPTDTTFVPMRKLPVTFQVGNKDKMWFGEYPSGIPMTLFDTSLAGLPTLWGIARSHTSTFGLDSTFTMAGDVNTIMTATFAATTTFRPREFRFVLIKDLGHIYPNGINHKINGAKLNWQWLRQFVLP